jgi:translation initiation factor IF-3
MEKVEQGEKMKVTLVLEGRAVLNKMIPMGLTEKKIGLTLKMME